MKSLPKRTTASATSVQVQLAFAFHAEVGEEDVPRSNSPEDAVRLVPVSALSGALCGIVCEVCPLRAWKSPGMTSAYCRDILEQHRSLVDSGALAAAFVDHEANISA